MTAWIIRWRDIPLDIIYRLQGIEFAGLCSCVGVAGKSVDLLPARTVAGTTLVGGVHFHMPPSVDVSYITRLDRSRASICYATPICFPGNSESASMMRG